MKIRGGVGRWLSSALAAALMLLSVAALQPAESASAVVGSQFDAGNIISDQYFFDAHAMSQAQIQTFLDSKIRGCSNSNCLDVLRVTTENKPARYTSAGNLICNAYAGATNEPASTIIFKVQQACGISAKVLLVTLQKEQGLVTKTSVTAGVLERAMGFGCPDHTGGTCASEYYGFFNQMYWASWQLKRYGTPTVFGTYQPGVNSIQWHPNASCGSSSVLIQNRATAALYNYTPYRPNAAALGNLYGLGDGCSSYGNRNFWVYYNDWFGSPTLPPGTPEGQLASVTATAGHISVAGWAVDPDAVTSAVAVSIQLDASWLALSAKNAGTDLDARYPGAGQHHDFSGTFSAAPGVHTICIYLVNAGGVGGTGTLGCQQLTVPEGPAPAGAITAATAADGVITFSGWAVQPDQPTNPVPVALNHGSTWTAMTANQPNATAPTKVVGAGPNQGFSGSFAAKPGVQTFCIWAARSVGGASEIGCRSVVVPESKPTVGAIDAVSGSATTIAVSGWAVWPSAVSKAVPVAVNIGSSWYALNADQANAGVEVAVPGAGANHGFAGSIPASAGTHNVCVWATQQASSPIMIGCRSVAVAAAITTRAQIESITPGASNVTVSGWAVWPTAATSNVPVAVNIGANWYALTADQPSTAAATAVPGAGPNHGYVGRFSVAPGAHKVCVWVAQHAGGAQQVGCEAVTVFAGLASVGELQTAVSGVGGVHYSGWAVDPGSPTAPVALAANVGGTWIPLATGKPNAVAPTKLSGAGPNQGFSGLFPAGLGPQTICVWAAGATGAVNLGCKTVTVTAPPAVTGALDEATAGAGKINVKGWAVWPSALKTAVPVAVNVGAQWIAVNSGVASTSAQDYVLGVGPNQGFTGTISAPRGSQPVCVWASSPTGVAAMLGCKTVVVP